MAERLLNPLGMRTAVAILGLLTASLLVGCGASGPEQSGDPLLGTPENPRPVERGAYQLQTTVDFTVEAILPAQVEAAVVTLRSFSTDPAHALLDLAEQRGVPAVGTIRDALPGVLEDKLEGWINDEIEKVKLAGKPITEYAGEIAMLAEIALTQFAVESELAIERRHHRAVATHRLIALDLRPTGLDLRVPIEGLAGDILTQTPSLDVAAAGALSIGEQRFGLPYGEFAWRGVEAASTAAFGGGVRASLGAALDCAELAGRIADRCVLGVCVGHATELRTICELGLDAVVDFAHEKFAAMRLDVLHFASGAARLVDDDGDGVGDRIVDGKWDAELDLGLGLRRAPAVFLGSRAP